MAVTSIWRVKGRLDKVVRYIENPEKTDNPEFGIEPGQGLEDVIDYAVNTAKTVRVDDEKAPVLRSFVTGVNCSPSTAREEMIAVKRRFGKEGGTIAYHGYQSFAPGEATPEIAHEIGVKLAQRLWGDRYQVLVATHLDKENHLHSHFVVNTVSFVDGIKYHRTAQDYREIFFDWDKENVGQDGVPNHVGIVEKVENGYVYTVEGNSGDMCRENRYAIGYYEILGYGVPSY